MFTSSVEVSTLRKVESPGGSDDKDDVRTSDYAEESDDGDDE